MCPLMNSRNALTVMAVIFFFFNDTATTEIYTLSPRRSSDLEAACQFVECDMDEQHDAALQPASGPRDRKSTRLNSSHGYISYAVFCLKKKKKKYTEFYLKKKKIKK